MALLSVSLGLFPGDSDTNVFKLSLSILVSVKQWFLLEFRCWVWQMGTGLREHMAEHVGPCFFLQRNLLSFLAALILVSSDRLHLCFLSCHRAWGWQGTSSRVLLLEIFWRRFTFHFSDFIFVVLKKKNLNLKSLVMPVGWLPFLPSWLWWPCFLCVHWHSFFNFKCDYCSPSLSRLQCVRSLPSTKDSLAPHFDSL